MDRRRRPERRRSYESPAADDGQDGGRDGGRDECKRRRGSADRSERHSRGRDRSKKARTSTTNSPPIASRLRYRSRRRPPRRSSPGTSKLKGGPESPSARSERYRKRRERQESAESRHHDRDRNRERERSRSRDRRGNGSRAARSRTRSRSHHASGTRSRTGSTGSSRRRRSGRRARRSQSGSRHRHERYEKRHSARRRPSWSPRGRRDRYEHRAHSRRRDSYDSGHRQRRHSREREYDDNGGYADDGRANGNANNSNNAKDASDDSAAHDDSVGTYDGRPGDYILSRYKILREAGVGTFGRVLECVDKKRNEIVAIKVVRKVDKYTESAKIEANILQDVNDKDVRNESLCVRMHKWFEYKGHVCMVFERLGCSLYDYLKNHDYKPFPLRCIRAYAWQLLTALEYCHRIKLIHTDLKPENILLVDDEEEPWGGASPSSSASSSSYDSPYASDRDQWSNHRQWKKRDLASSSQASGVHSDSDSQRAVLRPPASNAVKLIDFGGATYDHESKSSIINTRQYRSPEVILGLGWSYPSDIWSAGCIIAELYLGELLFATHENMEHLALIEKCIGRMPSAMASTASKQPVSNKFFSRGRLNWPARASSDESVEHVRKMRPLDQLILSDDKRAGLADLLRLMLTPDPDDRITAKDALSHPFFEGFSYRDVAPPSAVDAARASDANGSASRRSHSWRD